jgi:hypothetical protein
MRYRGKLVEQAEARRLRALGYTYKEIIDELGVARSSVSLWCRDVEVDEEVWRARAMANYRYGNSAKRRNALSAKKEREIEHLRDEGLRRIGRLSEKEFLVAGVALYAGEGTKRGNEVSMPNSDPRMVLFFVTWLRHFFDIDETRLRVHLYLHEGLDLDAANAFWSEVTGIPLSQFTKPYRAVPDPTIRTAKHVMGCPKVRYSCATTIRAIMGLVDALLTCDLSIPG